MDPYVCFRRREVRQTRKTRARDVQSADKLKRLRRELEEGRQIIMLAQEREIMKRELLTTDRYIYEQRARLKEAKVRLGIKTDDEDLINQKVIAPHSRLPPNAACANSLKSPRSGKPRTYLLFSDLQASSSASPFDLVVLRASPRTSSSFPISLPRRRTSCAWISKPRLRITASGTLTMLT